MFLDIKTILSVLESIFVIIGVCFLAIQIRQQTKIAEADHDRIKKQSTIEFYNLISTESQIFIDYIGNKIVDLEMIKSDIKLERSVTKYLSRLERLAVGIASDIYHFEILCHVVGSHFSKIYNQLGIYIREMREVNKTPRRYYEFELLVERIEKYRGENPTKNVRGNVTVSSFD
ncbi:MAG: DUF4760 domain-containing protein [Treponema sp.]|nr:DUF4760 domain-containing protein [Treponema sp.]